MSGTAFPASDDLAGPIGRMFRVLALQARVASRDNAALLRRNTRDLVLGLRRLCVGDAALDAALNSVETTMLDLARAAEEAEDEVAEARNAVGVALSVLRDRLADASLSDASARLWAGR